MVKIPPIANLQNVSGNYMRPTIFILLLTLLFFRAIGQSDSLIENKLCLKITPFSLVDSYNGSSLRLGSEIKLKNNFAIYSELGTFFPHSLINSFWFRKNSGILIKGELKRYLNKKKITSGLYNSIELFYKYQSYTTTDTINIKPNYPKDYKVYKNVYCATLKFGELVVYKSGLVMDLSVGLGVRFKFSKSTLTTEENNNILGEGDNATNIITNKAGEYIYPNFVIGIKFGYRLK